MNPSSSSSESKRLKSLRDYGILDTPPEEKFDDLTALAADICETPIALISLIDESRQWFKSRVGLAAEETARESAFCAHALALGGKDLMLVPDALKDERFADNPLVQGDPHIRSYAGAPLVAPDGSVLGTLSVIDRVPRQLTDRQLRALRVLSEQVMTRLELRRQALVLAESEARLFQVFSNCPVALTVHRWSDRTFVEVNAAFTDLLGWTNEDVVGRTTTELNIVGLDKSEQLRAELSANPKVRDVEITARTRTGEARRLLMSTDVVELRGELHALTTFVDITGRKQTEETLATKSAILAAVTESLAAYVERGHWGEAIGRLLRCALDQTQSEYGFIGVVVEGTKLRVLAHEGIVWDKVVNREFYETAMRRYAEVGYLEFTSFNNLFGRAITTGEVVIANMPDSDARSGGRPSGHPPMHSFLGVPIFAGTERQGVVALANRPGGFSDEDRRRIETLVQHAGGLCTSYRLNEDALVSAKARQKSEQDLRESNERFQLLAKATTDVVWDWNLVTNDLWWNDGYHRLFGYPPEATPPTIDAWTGYIHPEDVARVEQGIRRALDGPGKAWADEYRFRRKDGAYCVVLDRGSIIRDAQGKPVRMIGAMQDVTERRQAHLVATRLAAIVQSSDDAIIGKDLDGIITTWNRGAENIFGYKFEEIEGTSMRRLIPADRQDEETFILGKISRGESIERFETKRLTQEGRLIDVSITISPIRDTSGRITGSSSIARDVTERKRTEARFRRLVDSNAQGVMFWNAQREITAGNDALWNMLGYTREEVAAKPLRWDALTPPELADRDRRALAEIEATGVCVPYEKEFIRKDGTRLPILLGAAAFEDNPDEGLCFVLDLTERKKLEQQFLRAQRMESIGTLAGGIAHDLNNLLAPVTMGLGLLKHFGLNPEALHVVETMELSTKRGADLVKQVLTFARGVEGSRIALQPGSIVREIESIVLNTFPKNIVMETGIAPDLWMVLSDATQLNQVLLNLCVNARDAMPDGGRLKLMAQNVQIDSQFAVMNRGMAPGRYVLIQLIDTGCGIPQEFLDRIFEPFFTTKELGKGSGLGLSTVLGIVRSHGGFVNAYSEPGNGSTFKLYFPALSEGVVGDAADPGPDLLPRGRGELVLVVDDESTVLDITKHTLEAFGYKVITAQNGAEAVALYALHREQIFVVLTDMMMPVMDGPALIAALHRINPRVRIIAASGLNTNGNMVRATMIGVKHFLDKPYTADAMLRVLRKILAEDASTSRPPML